MKVEKRSKAEKTDAASGIEAASRWRYLAIKMARIASRRVEKHAFVGLCIMRIASMAAIGLRPRTLRTED